MSKWQNPPAMKMGTYVEIAIATRNLAESQAFYQRLGFEIVPRKSDVRPHILLTDGVIQIHLYETAFDAPVLLYRSPTPTHRLAHFKTVGLKFREQTHLGGRGRLVTFAAPGGFQVGIIDGPEEPQTSRLAGISKNKLGQFGELLVPTPRLDDSLEFWESVGFAREFVEAGSKRRATLSDGLMRITLHQASASERPVLTFFAGDLPKRLAELQSSGLTVLSQPHDVDGIAEHAILEAPEGTRLLLIQGDRVPAGARS